MCGAGREKSLFSSADCARFVKSSSSTQAPSACGIGMGPLCTRLQHECHHQASHGHGACACYVLFYKSNEYMAVQGHRIDAQSQQKRVFGQVLLDSQLAGCVRAPGGSLCNLVVNNSPPCSCVPCWYLKFHMSASACAWRHAATSLSCLLSEHLPSLPKVVWICVRTPRRFFSQTQLSGALLPRAQSLRRGQERPPPNSWLQMAEAAMTLALLQRCLQQVPSTAAGTRAAPRAFCPRKDAPSESLALSSSCAQNRRSSSYFRASSDFVHVGTQALSARHLGPLLPY